VAATSAATQTTVLAPPARTIARLVHGATASRRLAQGVDKQGSRGTGGDSKAHGGLAGGVSGERGMASRRVCRAGVGDQGWIETNQADEP
jgi:hypothetical protein